MTKDDEEKQRKLLREIQLSSNSEYIGKIRRRLQEDSAAREEREKRRRKVLVDQMMAHQSQEVRAAPYSPTATRLAYVANNDDFHEALCTIPHSS